MGKLSLLSSVTLAQEDSRFHLSLIARSRIARLRGQQLRNEDVFDSEEAPGDPLFEVIAKEGFQRLTIGFDPIEPPVISQHGAIVLDEPSEPRKHGVHVVENAPVLILLHSSVLCLKKARVEDVRQFRILCQAI